MAANHSDVLHVENGKEQVLVGPVVPVLVHGDAGLMERWLMTSC